MRLMVLADVPDAGLWDYLDRRRLEGVDLIVSCGDLPAAYLSFLTCFTHAPVVYVHGNHDADYEKRPPEGCICLDDRVLVYRGLRLAGLGGSMRYKPGPHQYTEAQMARRARRLRLPIARAGGLDVLVGHAALKDVGDAPDLCHQGFACMRSLVERVQPACYLHGHVHKEYDYRFQRERALGPTRVINAWKSTVVELPNPPEPGKTSRAFTH